MLASANGLEIIDFLPALEFAKGSKVRFHAFTVRKVSIPEKITKIVD